MKSIEITVHFTAKVPDEIANQIDDKNEKFYVDLRLGGVQLMRGPAQVLEATFIAYETTSVGMLE